MMRGTGIGEVMRTELVERARFAIGVLVDGMSLTWNEGFGAGMWFAVVAAGQLNLQREVFLTRCAEMWDTANTPRKPNAQA